MAGFTRLTDDSDEDASLLQPGEAPAQMKWARALANDTDRDTSIDGPWPISAWAAVDWYVWGIMGPILILKAVFLFVPMVVLLAPPVLLNHLYASLGRSPSDVQAQNGTRSWTANVIIQGVLSLPAQLLAAAMLVFDVLLMSVFGALWCTATCSWDRYSRNGEFLAPFEGGPSLYGAFPDIVAASAGLSHRVGVLEYLLRFAGMFVFVPWIKYWLTGNRWCTDLGHRFITQVGLSMADMDAADIGREFVHCVSAFKHTAEERAMVDGMGVGRAGTLDHYPRDFKFVPHYPHPPEGRDYAMAMQCATFTLVVCTTHMHGHSPGGRSRAERVPGVVLSTSSALCLYRVMLWRNNPYHLLTGWVEAGLTTGEPSQPAKRLGGEHPMWLVNSKNFAAADRTSRMSVGNIDMIFDRWIPFFVRFIRTKLQGSEVAAAHFERDMGQGYEEMRSV